MGMRSPAHSRRVPAQPPVGPPMAFPVTPTGGVPASAPTLRRFVRAYGEQPEPAPVSLFPCPFCGGPCADAIHLLWSKGHTSEDT